MAAITWAVGTPKNVQLFVLNDSRMKVTDLRGAISSEALHDLRFGMVAGPYPEAGYRASTRATAGEVASAPLDIATRLTDRLNRVLNDRRFVFGKRG